MRTKQIKKANGKTRTVAIQTAKEAAVYRRLAYKLWKKWQALTYSGRTSPAHGCLPGRNIVTNAQPHVGYAYTVSFDLSDMFDQIDLQTIGARGGAVERDIAAACCPIIGGQRRAWQGLSSSPMAANLVAHGLDMDILGALVREFDKAPAYTRYVDDLTFSTNSLDSAKRLLELIPRTVAAHGVWFVNESKTRLQFGTGWRRRMICGIAVDNDGVHPPREVKRRLRAALHRIEMGRTGFMQRSRARGLAEFCRCAEPRVRDGLGTSSTLLPYAMEDMLG